MAHYAFLDENNIVTEVIVGRNEWEVVNEVSDWEKWYGDFRGQKCLRTSYNGTIRNKFAKIGDVYDPILDIFVDPQPLDLGEAGTWTAPDTPYPDDDSKIWVWSEATSTWTELQS